MKKEILYKDRILQDFKKQEKFNLIGFIVIDIIIIALLSLVRFYFKGMVALVLNIIVLIFFIVFTFIKYSYYFKTVKKIKNDKFEIKKDKVENVENNYNVETYNDVIAVKFEDYKKILHLNKKKYKEIKKGDTFYLIYIEDYQLPINFYSTNDFKLDK